MRKWGVFILGAAAFLCVWEYFGHANNTVRLLLSRPSLVASYFVENQESLGIASLHTFVESILGLAAAIVFTSLVMGVCFYFPKLLQIVLPVMVFSQVVPLITLAPLFIMLLGLGIASKVAMAVLLCFFPLFVNFASGYVAIPRAVNELMYIYAAPRWFRILHVLAP
jgi:ABC-type nitrate/sulfonate/bicarbonate transport system permease component